MPVRRNNTIRVQETLRRKVAVGLGCAADRLAEEYAFNVSEVQGNIPPHVPPHSVPGEYPHIEFGQGAQNIGSGVSLERLESRAGLKGEATGTGPIGPYHQVPGGMHLHYLTDRGRLGVVDTFREHTEEIAEEFRSCAEAAR